ncbi:hypothetical protein KIM372_08120 [Bombiscardovia nodaiensis]|uniref:DUF2568 domain-containing protein n=1 Tax=Bombiscardovia nodaiensis TaxID=2932181 RepID=A0ABM8B7P6_9BIFI|nr:hypothetical protein KIM372_08120 [Bombiscardovia nodaiensis]
MGILPEIVLGIRFLVECATALGVFGGVFVDPKLVGKVLWGLLATVAVVVWSLWGAPNSSHPLRGVWKLALELIVFAAATGAYWAIYGNRATLIYAFIAFSDLALYYLLHMQGN